ncbi:serine hydrolase domain-containing protein [Streptomyces alanosinicus]|uniref:Beta-lactamase n=1 Tax=Streptomyces alanosinicus TaxID=68171 RepID=A0A919D384_9ACTN|nr:serine hydrolase domain-containing protein [Streptomyces alanosinicus]GHE05385.1 beta-lactamase [Streptomyces alanosinicus]
MPSSSARLRRGATIAVLAATLAGPLPAGAAVTPPGAVPAALGADPPGPSPSDSPSPSPSQPGVRALTPQVARQLDAAVQKVMHEADVPGATVGIWTPGQPGYVRSFGVADKSTGQKMAPDMYLRIGSETKTFTVTALLQLVDQKKVGLDDPIGRYIGGVPNENRITLRELAEMRSGLFNYSQDAGFFTALTSDPQRSFTPEQLLAYAFKHAAIFQPGEKFSYSNTNLILLGLVVEKVSGQRLGDYITQHILAPAGMRHTVFPAGDEFPTPHAQGYTRQTANGKEADAAGWNPSWGWAAGAMISTLDDLRTWAPTVATGRFPDGSRMVSAAAQKQRLITPSTSSVKGAGYGLGIFDVQGWIGHNGSLPGYESLTIYLPSTRTTLVALLNTDNDYRSQEPSTVLGEAITKIISPAHVYNLPMTHGG